MKANSSKWWALNEANDKAGLDALEEDQQRLAQELRDALPGMNIERKSNGVWYINGEELYKSKYAVYHTGGIVGDDPTLKQDEVFAKLKKGEAVFTEEQQKPLYQALDFADTMIAKYGQLFNSAFDSDLMASKMQDQIKSDGQQAQSLIDNSNRSYNISVTAPIHTVQKLDESEIKKLSKDISKYTINELDDMFSLYGKRNFRP